MTGKILSSAELLPGIWHVEESYRVYCTLVTGCRGALLFDTGLGRMDLAAWVAARTSLPCAVCLSHGHGDHAGGRGCFPKVLAHPADWPLLTAQGGLAGVKPLEPGRTFDLGGRTAEVISLAGHTLGSVGLLLREDRLLLAGDGLNPTLLLVGEEAASLNVLGNTLTAVGELPFDRYLSSHAPGFLSKAQTTLHLEHLEHLVRRPLPGQNPFGPGSWRSQYKTQAGRSVLFSNKTD